jgi:hypothetical protein
MTPSTDTPRREGSRDAQAGCLVCGKDTPSTRAKYCGRAHQQRSYRFRHQPPTPDLTLVRKALQRRKALVAHTPSTSAAAAANGSSASAAVNPATCFAEW